MGLFTPKWKKGEEQARAALNGARSADNMKTLYRIASECDYAALRAEAIRTLSKEYRRGFANENGEAGKYLSALTGQGVTAHDRCLAAVLFGDKKVQQIVFQKDLAEANREKPELEWLDKITDRGQLAALYPEADRDKDKKAFIISKLTDANVIAGLIKDEKHTYIIAAIAKELSRDKAKMIAVMKAAPGSYVTKECVGFLTQDDLDRFDDMIADDSLSPVRFALISRLFRFDPVRCTEKYFDRLGSDDQKKAIDRGLLSEEKLRAIAGWGSPAGREALKLVSDPAAAIRLMRGHLKPYDRCTDSELAVYRKLISAAAADQNALIDLLLNHSGELPLRSIDYFVDAVNSEKGLLRIALSGYEHAARIAAARLPDSYAETIMKKAHSESLREKAAQKFYSAVLPTADPGTAFEAFVWARGRHDLTLSAEAAKKINPAQALQALKEETQPVFCRMLAPNISDAAALTGLCFTKSASPAAPLVERIRELAANDDGISRYFAEKASQAIRCGNESAPYITADYFGISPAEAMWKYGGEQYVKYLLRQIESDAEYEKPFFARNSLRSIYAEFAESRALLDPVKNRRYKKHSDYIDYSCRSNDRSSEVELVLDFDS